MGKKTSGITVSGHGDVEGPPDLATMSFGVSLVRPRVDEAVAASSTAAEELHRALVAAGVDASDLQTTSYSINPEYDYSGNRRRLLGFRVSNSVVARLRDIEAVGSIIQAAADATGDDVQMGGLAFTVEDDSALVVAARDAAWADAAAKAEQLAALAGVSAGKATAISETSRVRPPMPVLRAAMAESAPAPPIEPGATTVAVDIVVTFTIA
jgi:uncharacterized protein